VLGRFVIEFFDNHLDLFELGSVVRLKEERFETLTVLLVVVSKVLCRSNLHGFDDVPDDLIKMSLSMEGSNPANVLGGLGCRFVGSEGSEPRIQKIPLEFHSRPWFPGVVLESSRQSRRMIRRCLRHQVIHHHCLPHHYYHPRAWPWLAPFPRPRLPLAL
jgi:hypothetical protein